MLKVTPTGFQNVYIPVWFIPFQFQMCVLATSTYLEFTEWTKGMRQNSGFYWALSPPICQLFFILWEDSSLWAQVTFKGMVSIPFLQPACLFLSHSPSANCVSVRWEPPQVQRKERTQSRPSRAKCRCQSGMWGSRQVANPAWLREDLLPDLKLQSPWPSHIAL